MGGRRRQAVPPGPRRPCHHSLRLTPCLIPAPCNLRRYTDAIAVKPDKQGLHLLLGNRSLAYLKAGRHAEALADADAAAALAPQWHKAHWRRGAALLGLRRVPEAVLAFRRAWGLAPSEPETERKLWATVQRLTREQLGGAIAALLQEVEANGGLRPPRVEAVSEAEAGEAWFRLLQAAHRGRPRPGQYYHRCACCSRGL